MSNDQTPIEGKGDEMIPERGLPFEEESQPEEQTSFEFEDFLDPENSEPALADASDEFSFEAETGTRASDERNEEASPTPENLLDIDEIRGHEIELAEDALTAATAFEGDIDGEVAAAKIPRSLPRADREAIMLESGAGIIEEASPDSPMEPENMDESSSMASSLEEELPPPAESVTTKTVVVQETRGGEPFFSKASFELPGPVSAEDEVKAPATAGDLKATKKMLDLLITNKTVELLWKRADDLQAEVIDNIEDISVARSLLEHIRSARTRLLERKDNYEEAERELNEVEFRLSFNQRSRQWRGLGYGILAYEVIWGTIFLILTGILLVGGENSLRIQDSTMISRAELFIGLGGMLWGGMGGVVGALYALWRYITAQKFNPQFNIWYLSQPIMGVFIGAFIFLFIKIGFNVTAGNPGIEIGSPWMVYLLGFIGGFQQNVLYDIVKQVLKLFKLGSDDGKSSREEG